MFFSRHLYIVILCYVLLILGVAGTGLVLIVTHTGIIIGCLIIIISFFITGALVKRLNKSNAKLKLFFDAIEDKENMIQFNEYSGDSPNNIYEYHGERVYYFHPEDLKIKINPAVLDCIDHYDVEIRCMYHLRHKHPEQY